MDDLTGEFLEETNESLEALDMDFVRLEQNPNDKDIIGNIFRVMHTIKGTCGFLGLSRLEKVAHAAENIMDKLRDGRFKITPEITSLILEANDAIKMIIAHIEKTEEEPVGSDADLINRLNTCAETGVATGGVVKTPSKKPQISAKEEPVSKKKVEKVAMPKTPDLDGEIDFEPIPAPEAAFKQESAGGSKTPDLDGEVDFEPIPAPGVESVPVVAAKGVVEGSESDSAEENEAVEEGLKTSAEEGPHKKASSGQSIRVSLDVLEDLMQMVGELVLTRNQLLQMTRDQGGHDGENKFAVPLQRLNHITSELQEGVMQTRMQPIGNAWAKFPRMVRDLALDLNKKIDLRMIGAETELDRQMLEAIKDPLTHMVRNAADHGIELPKNRVALGKPEAGVVTLSAYHEGGHIIIKVSDDGKGLDLNRIKAKAIENGLATESELAAMSDKQIYQFVYKAGFSTAEKVTAVSGRGVGMDVVVSNIEKIGGTVELNSWSGKGSEFLIELPLTLAIMPVLIVQSGEETFAIPQIRVSEIVRADKAKKAASSDAKNKNSDTGYRIETIDNAPVLRLRGRLLPLISLASTLHFDRSKESDNDNVAKNNADVPHAKNEIEEFIVVCEVGSQKFGILVDKVFHTEEIVVKPVAPILKGLEVYSGCTILGDGSVIMILDPNGIIRSSGITNMREEEGSIEEENRVFAERVTSFLLFKAWRDSPKAVPLELVSRLEEVDAAKIEWSGDQMVVQYRDKLMRLVTLNPSGEVPKKGIQEVIVFSDEDRIMGLMVEEILDIVKQEMDIKSLLTKDGLLGSMVIEGTTTDLIDVSYFFSSVFQDWLGNKTGITVGNREKRILLVDDSPFFRKFMKPVLVVAGYSVTTAESGADALMLLENDQETYDVVVTDIDMPEMNGIEFVAKCKKNERLANIPYIALSSHAESELGVNFAEKGFSNYVSKSDRDKLVTVINDSLSFSNKAAA